MRSSTPSQVKGLPGRVQAFARSTEISAGRLPEPDPALEAPFLVDAWCFRRRPAARRRPGLRISRPSSPLLGSKRSSAPGSAAPLLVVSRPHLDAQELVGRRRDRAPSRNRHRPLSALRHSRRARGSTLMKPVEHIVEDLWRRPLSSGSPIPPARRRVVADDHVADLGPHARELGVFQPGLAAEWMLWISILPTAPSLPAEHAPRRVLDAGRFHAS
jgi:hypothetical protein